MKYFLIILFPLFIQAQTPTVVHCFYMDDHFKRLDPCVPNIAKNTYKEIFEKGINYTNFLTTAPRCAPNRASFLSGEYGHTNLVHGHPSDNKSVFIDTYKDDNIWSNVSDLDVYVLVVGKSMRGHDTYDNLSLTLNGMDHNTSFSIMDYESVKRNRNGVLIEDNHYKNRIQIEFEEIELALQEYTENHSEKDLLIVWATNAIHRSNDAAKTDMFTGNANAIGNSYKASTDTLFNNFPQDTFLGIFSQEREAFFTDNEFRNFAKALHSWDVEFGKYVALMKANGLWDNTYKLWFSDNGYQVGEYGLRSKRLPYEQSINVPLRFVTPTSVKSVNDALIHTMDVTATIINIFGGQSSFKDGDSFLSGVNNRDYVVVEYFEGPEDLPGYISKPTFFVHRTKNDALFEYIEPNLDVDGAILGYVYYSDLNNQTVNEFTNTLDFADRITDIQNHKTCAGNCNQ